ncbi:tRNA (adenosine(37)-N6)-dimethylallyltransferase MiaA [Moraxella caviae]|uniref:tRNA dimethylallyltransferase n=1 Tax=Moraxella caviae TaxID=34060 RepID=A0A1T0A8M6_9GAMM|nr:tRNA (adenosine(37)-N6)-dimethylallyltransferase MiaA [Moraxella caviae]OOR92086.1 tRNA (adenosine(37)-N6)-dimethylallyltransferase MiaA [Moraxella caviae]STZ14441.1 tRNA dimethylallyltransferase [Moraxella caviae]VEW10472.1 tRNA dimethylallyltransferase [Moraxella caviae]
MNHLPHYAKLPDNAVLSLIAPTASGKTDLACRLYDTGRFELISVDSALIYRAMDIGTAKPSCDELVRYPHHLVDIISPEDSYSVAQFTQDVSRLIGEIHGRGKIPLLVGGTMMYYLALFEGLSAVPDSDKTVREQVAKWRSEAGMGELYAFLQDKDPVICKRLTVSDTQRITRAVEVYLQTGKPMSWWQNTPKTALAHSPNQTWLAASVMPDRAWLHERIDRRLIMMWQAGFLAEVVALLTDYALNPDMPSLRCVGYRQAVEFLATVNHPVMQRTDALAKFTDGVQQMLSGDERDFFAAHYAQVQAVIDNPNEFLRLADLPVSRHKVASPLQIACQTLKNRALYATRQLAKRQYTWQRSLAKLDKASDGAANLRIVAYGDVQTLVRQLLGEQGI